MTENSVLPTLEASLLGLPFSGSFKGFFKPLLLRGGCRVCGSEVLGFWILVVGCVESKP